MSLANQFYAGREMITSGEVAKRLGIHSNTLYTWIQKDCGIPFHVVPGFGRLYDWAEVQAWSEAVKDFKPKPALVPKTASEEKAAREARHAEVMALAEAALAAAAERVVALKEKKEAA